MLLSISPKLTAAALSMIPLLSTTAMLKRLSTRRQAKRVASKLAEANARADERLKNLRTVKVFAQERHRLNITAIWFGTYAISLLLAWLSLKACSWAR